MEKNQCSSTNNNTDVTQCLVCDILEKGFSCRTHDEKINILKKGREMPNITITSSRPYNRSTSPYYTRHFHPNQYLKVKWLTGCCHVNRLFCWTCLLFSTEKKLWNKTGYNDMINFANAEKRHSSSKSHLLAVLSERTFVKVNIDCSLGHKIEVDHQQHNDIVVKNREIIKRFVNVICFLSKQELPFKGCSEINDSLNRGNYQELIHFISHYDLTLKHHLENSTVFTELSNLSHNDLILAISNVIMQWIRNEIKECNFVSIILDDTTDGSNKSQLSCTLRYCSKPNIVQERFVGFIDVSDSCLVEALCEIVKRIVVEYGCEKKLISQSYNGTTLMASHLNSLQVKLQEMYPNALFIPYIAHGLALVLSQSACTIKECRIFFRTLNGLATFFSRSTKRTIALNEQIIKGGARSSTVRWDFQSRTSTVQEYHDSIVAVFERIADPDENWDQESVIAANGFLVSLKDFTFCFFLNMFADIFPNIEILQKNVYNIECCIEKFEAFSDFLKSMHYNFNVLWERCNNYANVNELKNKRLRYDNNTDIKSSFRYLYCEVLYSLTQQMTNVLNSLESLVFVELVSSKNRKKEKNSFLETGLETLKDLYGELFDYVALRAQLISVYASKEFDSKNICELAAFIRNNNLDEAYEEVDKLCELILTLPLSSESAERSFATLKRMKTYTRNTINSLSQMAFLSIEKNVISDLQKHPDFYNQVIDEFVKEERSIELCYK